MKPIPVAVQLYSVREEAKKDLRATLRGIAKAGYAGVELAGMYGMKPAELRLLLDDLGLRVMSTHGALVTEANRDEVVEQAQVLGNLFHISGFGPDQFATREKTLECAAAFEKSAQLLKPSGLRYGWHNHWWEFSNTFDGVVAQEVALRAAPTAFAQVDTYWCAVGGQDPAAFIRAHAGRVPLLHIKDGPLDRDKAMTAVGGGRMVWKPVLETAVVSGVEWLVVELDRCDTDMMVAVESSIRYLVESGYGSARA